MVPLSWLIAGSLLGVALLAATFALRSWRRERARAELLEGRLDALCASLPVGIFQTDNEGRCCYANDHACRLAGLDLGGALGDAWMDAVHPHDRDRVVSAWTAAAPAGSPYRGEYRFIHPDGSSVWVLSEVRPHRDATGRTQGYIGAITDITAHKEMENELERSRADLERRVAERTAVLLESNRRLAREMRIRERLLRAIGQMTGDANETQASAPDALGVDQ